MDAGDIYQFRVTYGLVNDQNAVITTYWRAKGADGSSGAFEVFGALEATFIDAMVGLVNEDQEVSSAQVINGMDNLDFYEEAVATAGTRTGTALPTFIGFGIRSFLRGPGYRRSRHTLPFGSVSDLDSFNGFWSSAIRTAADPLIESFGEEQDVGTTQIEPVQLAGSFILGTEPTVRQVLTGQWERNDIPTKQDTRQGYSWTAIS